jgi:hypothetical protein
MWSALALCLAQAQPVPEVLAEAGPDLSPLLRVVRTGILVIGLGVVLVLAWQLSLGKIGLATALKWMFVVAGLVLAALFVLSDFGPGKIGPLMALIGVALGCLFYLALGQDRPGGKSGKP